MRQLKAKTPYLREKLANGATLEDILPEAFAVAREASKRVLKMRHFDVQLVGGMVLHEGKVAEMRTGEGKTLTATLPLYLNALAGKGAHLVTVNDYLARRDAEWMGRLYSWLGLTIGVIQHGLDDQERRDAYGCDITYATNNELGFDYLRDNMKWDLEDFTQRGFHYAIVDEVDSILIDEARTPLIIAGSSEEDTSKYFRIDAVVPKLKAEVHYKVDEKDRQVMLTDEGIHHAEQLLGVANLYDPGSIETLHGLNQALLAHNLYRLDVDYMVRPKEDGKGMEVVIVDEFTGRLMPGRRWSNGLHQAIEAKEGVEVNAENQTLATVTFQNFFRMYGKLAGMTGTAETEATELHSIYKLDVIIVPTNMPMVRKDFADTVYATRSGKKKAIVEEIRELHTKGQPVLVGTASIESSEDLADALKAARIPHVVLNAKHHEQEAEIVAQAGARAPSPSPPTWPAAARTSSWAAIPRAWPGWRPRRRTSPSTTRRAWKRRSSPPSWSRCASRPRPSTRKWSASAACTSWAPSATRAAASTTSSAAAPAARATPAAAASTCPSRTT